MPATGMALRFRAYSLMWEHLMPAPGCVNAAGLLAELGAFDAGAWDGSAHARLPVRHSGSPGQHRPESSHSA